MSEFYKHKKSTETTVGIIVLISFIILIGGYAWLTNSLKKNNMQELDISFSDAGRLEVGDSVLIRGITKGLVEEVALSDDGVIVRCLIDYHEELPVDTQFLIKEKSMMGGHLLEIVPGISEKSVDLTKTLRGQVEPGLFTVVNQASTLITEIETLIWRLTKDEGMIHNLEDSSNSAKKILNKTNNLLANNSENLTNAVNNFSSSLYKVDYLLSQNVEHIDQTLTSIPKVIRDAEDTLLELKGVISQISTITKDLNDGTGTAGKLLKDKELYDSLKNTVDEADSLLQDIKKHPKKYLKISVF
ncbi:MAG: MlaD family protein [Candidatus Zophobacter franzmannii]|nr:MlaD family protein [Candidatus Zophobacter franzmannii]